MQNEIPAKQVEEDLHVSYVSISYMTIDTWSKRILKIDF